MKIKPSPLCDLCKIEEDSNEHMLISCTQSQQPWREVEDWLMEIGVREYTIDEQTVIFGDLQKSYWIIVVILITKKAIFNAKIDGKIPKLFSVKNNTISVYKHDLLKFRLMQKEDLFKKRWGMMIDYMEEE